MDHAARGLANSLHVGGSQDPAPAVSHRLPLPCEATRPRASASASAPCPPSSSYAPPCSATTTGSAPRLGAGVAAGGAQPPPCCCCCPGRLVGGGVVVCTWGGVVCTAARTAVRAALTGEPGAACRDACRKALEALLSAEGTTKIAGSVRGYATPPKMECAEATRVLLELSETRRNARLSGSGSGSGTGSGSTHIEWGAADLVKLPWLPVPQQPRQVGDACSREDVQMVDAAAAVNKLLGMRAGNCVWDPDHPA